MARRVAFGMALERFSHRVDLPEGEGRRGRGRGKEEEGEREGEGGGGGGEGGKEKEEGWKEREERALSQRTVYLMFC